MLPAETQHGACAAGGTGLGMVCCPQQREKSRWVLVLIYKTPTASC